MLVDARAFVQDVCALVGRLRFLKKLDCRENPVCTTPKYWERVVMASSSSLGESLSAASTHHSPRSRDRSRCQNSWMTNPSRQSNGNLWHVTKCTRRGDFFHVARALFTTALTVVFLSAYPHVMSVSLLPSRPWFLVSASLLPPLCLPWVASATTFPVQALHPAPLLCLLVHLTVC